MNSGDSELDKVLQSASEMVYQIRKSENKLDEMLSRAFRINQRIEAMKNYNKMLNDMRSLTVNGKRRELILDDLQRENRQIMALQDENRQLRESTSQCLSTIRNITNSHKRMKKSIKNRLETCDFDEVDDVLFELGNRELETKLKNSALNVEKLVNDLNVIKMKETTALTSSISKNKEYREIFQLACISNPRAIDVLNNAMAQIIDEIKNGGGIAESEESDEEENVHDTTIKLA